MTKWDKFNVRYEALLIEAGNRTIRLAGEKLAVAEREIKGRQRSGKPMDSMSCLAFLQALIQDPVLAAEAASQGALGFLPKKFLKKMPSRYEKDQEFNPNDFWAEDLNVSICALVLMDLQRVHSTLLKDSLDESKEVQSFVLGSVIEQIFP